MADFQGSNNPGNWPFPLFETLTETYHFQKTK